MNTKPDYWNIWYSFNENMSWKLLRIFVYHTNTFMNWNHSIASFQRVELYLSLFCSSTHPVSSSRIDWQVSSKFCAEFILPKLLMILHFRLFSTLETCGVKRHFMSTIFERNFHFNTKIWGTPYHAVTNCQINRSGYHFHAQVWILNGGCANKSLGDICKYVS